jgi:hypothetical protein
VNGTTTAGVELRRYIDGWLHLYRTDELDSDQVLVTPRCAEMDPFHGIDHEQALIGDPTQRGEIHPGCLTPWPRRLAPDPANTVVMPAIPAAIGGAP